MARLLVRYSLGVLFVLLATSLFLYAVLRTSPTAIHERHKHISSDLYKQLQGECTGYPPSYGRGWFRPLEEYAETQLVFFGKPIMQALKAISLGRHWKVKLILNESATAVKRLDALVSPRKFTVLFTSSRALRNPSLAQYVNRSNLLVAAIPNIYKVSGAKREQYKAFQRVLNRHGCSIEDTHIMPRSYLLDSPKQCSSFFNQVSNSPPKMWVLKTSQGYGGDGVFIYPNVSKLRDKFGSCKHNRQLIVQEYIQNILLVEGRKFDVRALVLVGNTQPYMIFHHEGYLRVSVRQFDPHGGREVHLTNSHVQTSSKYFQPEKHFWTFMKFQSYLDQHHPGNQNFVSHQLVPFIKKMSILIVKSSK